MDFQAYEKQHREAVRAAALNARLNTLEDDDPAPLEAPTTDARTPDRDTADDMARQHKERKSKSRKRDRRRREAEDDGEDDTAARLHRARGKAQWQLDEEQYDQECVPSPLAPRVELLFGLSVVRCWTTLMR